MINPVSKAGRMATFTSRRRLPHRSRSSGHDENVTILRTCDAIPVKVNKLLEGKPTFYSFRKMIDLFSFPLSPHACSGGGIAEKRAHGEESDSNPESEAQSR